MLKDVEVAELIQARADERSKRTKITQDRVLEEYAKLAFSNMMDFIKIESGVASIDFSEMTRDQAAALQEIVTEETNPSGVPGHEIVKTKLKLRDKRGALQDVARHLGMFVDKHEHEVKAPPGLSVVIEAG